MAVFYNDTLTDTGGVDNKIELTDHTSDSGHTYVRSSVAIEIDTAIDKLVANDAGNARQFWRAVVTPASADYKESMDVTVEALVDFTLCGPGVRVTGTSETPGTWSGYFAVIDPDLDQLQIVKYESGSETGSVGTPYTIGLGTPPETHKVTIEAEGTTIKAYLDDVERVSGTDSAITAAGNPGGIIRVNTSYGHFSVDNSSAETLTASGPSITSSPATAFPGQSRTIEGTGFGATQGTGGVTIGGVAQTITAWSDTSVSFTTVLGTNSYGTGKTLELTTDSAETDTATIELVADTAGGFGVVTMSDPNTTDDSSVAFDATPTVVTGDQFEWEDFNALGNLVIGADGFVESVDTEGTFRGRFWDATDSTWGTVENFTATVPDEIGPVTTSVNVPAADTYAIGDTLSFTVNWDENANVTGTPRLPLTFGSGQRNADYASGTGTTALVFSYTVQEGDEDTDGIVVSDIDLNGGTIQDGNSNAATLTLNGLENTAGIIVDGIRPVISVGNTTTSDTTPTVSGSAGDATSLTLVVTGIDTFNPTPSGGSWSQTLPESSVGEYDMTLDGTDAAGNTAVQASGTLIIEELATVPIGGATVGRRIGNRKAVRGATSQAAYQAIYRS